MKSTNETSSMLLSVHPFLGLIRIINLRCIFGILGREITVDMVIYGVYIRSSIQL